MRVQVNIHEICSKEELDDLVNNSAGIITYNYTPLADGNFDTFACITFEKCSLVKYMLLKRYAKKKGNKVQVFKVKE